MKIKSVVKVMNFHSLLRVESSRAKAERLSAISGELEEMISLIMNNRNFRLDKLIKLPDKSNPKLRIYIGSDFGFCGNVNSSVNSVMHSDRAERIILGKKLHKSRKHSIFLFRDEVDSQFSIIKETLERAVRERCWSAVEIVYNHYYNSTSIKQVVKRIYPVSGTEEFNVKKSSADYMIEGNPEEMIIDMYIEYMIYEIKIAMASSYAAENIMRQNTTTESIKKIDEIEQEEKLMERKKKNAIEFGKTVDNFIKQKSLMGV